MELTQETIEFLNEYGKSFLKKNDFEGLLKRLVFNYDKGADIALELLNFFNTETDINMFDYMSTVVTKAFCEPERTRPAGAEIDIDGRVSIIASEAFSSIKGLKKVVIGDNVEIIDEAAFANCKDLVSLHLGDSVKIIRKRAFANTHLKHIYLPESVILIGADAFPKDCYLISPRRKRKSLKFPKNELAWYKEHLVLDPKLSIAAEPNEEESAGEEI